MSEADRRRGSRLQVRIPAVATIRGEPVELLTENVAMRGVFLRTDEPLPMKSLIPLTLFLPPDDTAFETHGVAVHRVDPGEDRSPGVAFQFYGMDQASRRRWKEFLEWVEVAHPSAAQSPVVLATSTAPDPIKRRNPRFDHEVEVQFNDLGQLFRLYTQDISTGGMLLKTDLDLSVGEELTFQIVHPETKIAFALRGIVRRKVQEHGRRGLGVEFLDVDEQTKAEFFQFVLNMGDGGTPLPRVSADDPNLV